MSYNSGFEKSFENLINDEGFNLSHVKNDRGGETYAGITRKYYPNWAGWEFIDKGVDPLLGDVDNFYYKEYWQKLNCDKMKDKIAESIFNFAVNAGKVTAVKLAQKVLGIKQDGIIGENTLKELKKSLYFIERYAVEKVVLYVGICERDASQRKFFFGWIKNRSLQCIQPQ